MIAKTKTTLRMESDLTIWLPGDKALCIRRGMWHESGDEESWPTDCPVNGEIYLVEFIWHCGGGIGLYLAGFRGWWDSVEFRKIVPVTQRGEEESEATAGISAVST